MHFYTIAAEHLAADTLEDLLTLGAEAVVARVALRREAAVVRQLLGSKSTRHARSDRTQACALKMIPAQQAVHGCTEKNRNGRERAGALRSSRL